MEFHIGEIIRQRLDEVGMTKREFARRINITSQNVYDIFKRKSIDTGLLLSISIVLQSNFFDFFSIQFQEALTDQNHTFSGDDENDLHYFQILTQLRETEMKALKESSHVERLNLEVAYLKEINMLLKETLRLRELQS